MEQKITGKKKWLIRLTALLVPVLAAVAVLLLTAEKRSVLALELDLEGDNCLEIQSSYRKASSGTGYKYSTGNWYLALPEKNTEEEKTKLNGSKTALTEIDYREFLQVEGTIVKQVPENPEEGQTYTTWRRLDGQVVLDWLEGKKDKDWLHAQAGKQISFVANRLSYAYEASSGNRQQYGPFYNYAELTAFPETKWGVSWSGASRDAMVSMYGQDVRLNLKYVPFEIEVRSTVNGGYAPDSYDYGELVKPFPYGEVFLSETIPAIEYPGWQGGFYYAGYQWEDGNGKIIAYGSGETTEPFTACNIEGGSLKLVFLYRPDFSITRPVTVVPTIVTPVPTETITPVPTITEGSVRVTFDADGGYVSPDYKYVTPGLLYGELPEPERSGYTFLGWYYSEGNGKPHPEGYPVIVSTSRVKVDSDHTLKALWKKDPGPSETPIPPSPTPVSSTEYYRERHNYYTTDKGYTLDSVASDSANPLAGCYSSTSQPDADYDNGGRLTSAEQTERTVNYTVGTDASGNEWYFIVSGNSATHVHPKTCKINGKTYAVSTDTASITELVFPDKLKYNRTTYKVASIGGGGASYHAVTTAEKSDENVEQSGDRAEWFYQPEYGYYYYDYTSSDYMDFWTMSVDYVYGVLGNGYILSSADVNYEYTSRYKYEYGAAEYHVYNTTLKKVSVPQGVEILRGAFLYCQALEEVEISGAVAAGVDSFRAATMTEAELSPTSAVFYDGNGVRVTENIEYRYNGSTSKTEKTAVMLSWEEVVPLAPWAYFSEFTSITNIKETAFAFRTNMHDIILGAGLSTVEQDAFYKSCLDAITFSGSKAAAGMDREYTLGTGGVEHKTILYCPETAVNVIKYGMKWHACYELRCGYTATYYPEGGVRSDTGEAVPYVETTKAQSVLPDFEKTFLLKMAAKTFLPAALDKNGQVWYYMDGLVQRMDCLAGYDIVNIEGDKEKAGFYYIETSAGDVYYAKINITYEKTELVDIEKLFNIKEYRDAGKECGYNCLEPSPGGAVFGAYYRTTYSASSKKYYRCTVSYTTSGGISAVWSYASSIALKEEEATAGTTTGNYWEAEVSTAINGTKVTFSTVDPDGDSASTSFTGSGSSYTSAEPVYIFYGYAASSQSPPQGAPSSSYTYYTDRLYAVKNASGIHSLVLLGSSRTTGTSGTSYGFSTGNNLTLDVPLGSLAFYKNSGTIGSPDYNYHFLGKGTDGIWYEVAVTEVRTSFTNAYGSGTTYGLTLSEKKTSLPPGLVDIKDIFCTDGTTMVLDTAGNVWTGTSLDTLVKQTLPEKVAELYPQEDLFIAGNRMYILSTGQFLLTLGDTYTIYDDMITTGGNIYRRSDGALMMEQGSDFVHETVFPGIFFNSGTLYFKKSFHEVPGVTDTIKFVHEIKSFDIFYWTDHAVESWNTEADGTGTEYLPGNTVELHGNLDLHAVWKERYNTIRFHPNDENVTNKNAMPEMKVSERREQVVLPLSRYENPGKTFLGWGLTSGKYAEGEPLVSDGAAITNEYGTLHLYAKWKPLLFNYTLVYMKYPYGTEGNTAWMSILLSYDGETTAPEGPAVTAKVRIVTYDMNTAQFSGAGIPDFIPETLTEDYTEATAAPVFEEWEWWKENGAGEDYKADTFKAGETISKLTTENGDVVCLYPDYGKAPDAGVILPSAVCKNLTFIGWSEDIYADPEDKTAVIYPGTDPAGDEISTFTPVKHTTLYGVWSLDKLEILLDDRGATSLHHTEKIYISSDETGPAIVIPEKTGYTFQGYYTGTRGAGVQYYNAYGKCIKAWEETDVDCLYACWVQDEVKLPVLEDYSAPVPLPELTMEGKIERTDAKGLLYADDYDSTTDALTDRQPYLIYDTPFSEGAIPGTEYLAFRAKMGAWMLRYKFHRNSGTDMVRVYVTVPYRTQYEQSSNEELVISERKFATGMVEVPKAWSYWEVVESGLYYPQMVQLTNAALKQEKLLVAVKTDGNSMNSVPECEIITYGKKEKHVFWENIDEDGMPRIDILLTEEQYIISDVLDCVPDVASYLAIVCKNTAQKDNHQAAVRNDRYICNGESVLNDSINTDGAGTSIAPEKLPVKEEIAVTSYLQTYCSGIELDETKKNDTYFTRAVLVYAGDKENIGVPAVQEVPLKDINEINIHTPVACKGILLEEGTEKNENYIVLRIENAGTHRMSFGYGAGNFATALSGKSNLAVQEAYLNQVKFPFDVYVGKEDTFSRQERYLLHAGDWMTIGVESKKFYIPAFVEDGNYEIECRSIAVNCPKEEDGNYKTEDISQKQVNTDWTKYVATDTIPWDIRGSRYDFRITAADDPAADKQLASGSQALTLKKGYGFSYEFILTSEYGEEPEEIVITPRFFLESGEEEERQEVELYPETEFLHEERKKKNGKETVTFTGKGLLPARTLCVAVTETESLKKYLKQQTITGKEAFFIRDGCLIVQFEIRIKNNAGVWYIYDDWMDTELAADAVAAGWKYAPGDVIRYDLSQTIEEDYEIGGAE